MSTAFLNSVLPPSGPYHVFVLQRSDGKETQRKGFFHTTIDGVVSKATQFSDAGWDSFFALASFKDALLGRTADNAAELRAFFLDIDCKEGKGYEDQAAAAVAVREFLQTTGFPEPWIINSGRGLHVYWPFTEAVPAAQWKPAAERFKALALTHLKADPVVPADTARVLRMPGTENHKYPDERLLVQVVSEGVSTPFEELVALLPEGLAQPALPGAVAMLSAAKQHGMDDMTRHLADGDYPPSEFSRIARRSLKGTGCEQIRHAIVSAHELEEPLWRAALSIAWRCTDRDTAIHKLSDKHPGYSPEETVSKASRTAGPMTCKRYRTNYPSKCADCTLAVTSPILLGKKIEEAKVEADQYVLTEEVKPIGGAPLEVITTVPKYPYPYFRPATGGVARYETDKDGNKFEVQVYPYDLYVQDRFYDSDEQHEGEGELARIVIHTPKDGVRRIIIPLHQLLVREKLRDILLRHGVIVFDKAVSDIMAYFASSIRNMQKALAADRTRNQMGWTQENDSFVVGELEYFKDVVRVAPAAMNTRLLTPHLRPSGTLSGWKSVANFYNQPGMEPHALTVLLGFAAPLLRLIGGVEVRGATVNLISTKSGTGKTTAQMVVNSIFGHPSSLLLKKSDTLASKIQFLGMMQTIAVTMDEITNMSDEDVSELVYSLPEGRGKHRMESQSNRLRTNFVTWNTLAITSSNASCYDKLNRLKATADGEIRRLIEIPFSRPMYIDKAVSDRVFGQLNHNYGIAGPLYVQYIMRNKTEIIEQAERIKPLIDTKLKLDQSDRFYSVLLTCVYMAAKITADMDILNYNTADLFSYAMELVAEIRKDVVAPVSDLSQVAKEALGDYIAANINNALVINSPRNGVPQAGTIAPKGRLMMRYEPDTHELWVPCTELRGFLISKQIDVRQAMHDMAEAKILHKRSIETPGFGVAKRMLAGTSLTAPAVRCYCFDGKALDLSIDAFSPESPAAPAE